MLQVCSPNPRVVTRLRIFRNEIVFGPDGWGNADHLTPEEINRCRQMHLAVRGTRGRGGKAVTPTMSAPEPPAPSIDPLLPRPNLVNADPSQPATMPDPLIPRRAVVTTQPVEPLPSESEPSFISIDSIDDSPDPLPLDSLTEASGEGDEQAAPVEPEVKASARGGRKRG